MAGDIPYTKHFPSFQGTIVTPSGHLPSDWSKYEVSRCCNFDYVYSRTAIISTCTMTALPVGCSTVYMYMYICFTNTASTCTNTCRNAKGKDYHPSGDQAGGDLHIKMILVGHSSPRLFTEGSG